MIRLLKQYFIIKIVWMLCLLSFWFASELTNQKNSEPSTMPTESPETYQQELVRKARDRAGCRRPKRAIAYTVCQRLPFTDVSCGRCAKGCSTANTSQKLFRVPDVIHFIWFGTALNFSHFHQYLALRSVASIQRPNTIQIHYNADIIIQTEIWQRIQKEIPCIQLNKYRAPEEVFGRKISEDLFKADVARLNILEQHGGVYLDLDVITLREIDPLRIYPAAVGRSKQNKASNGIIFSEPASKFLKIWLRSYSSYDPKLGRSLAYWGLNVPYNIYLQNKHDGIVHLDEVLLNRPNPYVDSIDATTTGHYSLKNNYFLHIHPAKLADTEYFFVMDTWIEEDLRTLDSTYGQAARIALFGSSDLVYREGEFYREPFTKKDAPVLSLYDPSA